MKPRLRAAARDRSMISKFRFLQRSLTVTTTERLFARFFTLTFVPCGIVGWAAVIFRWSKIAPELVSLPW
jgi:hypothetical protein